MKGPLELKIYWKTTFHLFMLMTKFLYFLKSFRVRTISFRYHGVSKPSIWNWKIWQDKICKKNLLTGTGQPFKLCTNHGNPSRCIMATFEDVINLQPLLKNPFVGFQIYETDGNLFDGLG